MLTRIFKKGSFPLFFIVGALNTLFGYSIFVIGIYCGLHYTVASLVSLCVGVVFSFHTMGKIVFDHFEFKLITKFIFIYFCMYLVNISLLKANTYYIHNMYLNGLMVTLFMASIAFLLNKHVVFKK